MVHIKENEKINPSDDLVAQFILKSLPKETLGALRLIAMVKYPIEDRQAFVVQLDNLLSNPEEAEQVKDTVQHIKESLTALDFPMLSLQSGMEKLYTKLFSRFSSNPNLFVPGLSHPEVPARDVKSEYINRFGPLCGLVAFNAYLQAPRNNPVEDLAAYSVGLAAGRLCP